MSNPFDCFPRSSSLMSSILLVSVCVIFMSVMVSVNTDFDFEPKNFEYESPKRSNPNSNNFKRLKIPSDGTVRLVNGSAKVIHHNIKEDSTIILSRKTIDGSPGQYLIIEHIEPNQHFVITSKGNSTAEETESVTEEEDFGEVYFIVV